MSSFLPGRSYIVTGAGDWEANLTPVLPVDRVELDGAEVGIKELRSALTKVSERPYGETRLMLITNAESLSEACQNTLLKALEEPPAYLIIVLRAEGVEKFLPTVRSRLHVHRYQEKANYESSLPSSEAEAARVLQGVKERSSLVNLLKQELKFQLQSLAKKNVEVRLNLLDDAIMRLERNCNQKLVIDHLLLHWFGQNGNG